MMGGGAVYRNFVDTSLAVCKQKNPKFCYEKALTEGDKQFYRDIIFYKIPKKADIHIQTDKISIEEAVNMVMQYLKERKYVR